MTMSRRDFTTTLGAALLGGTLAGCAHTFAAPRAVRSTMYGLIGKMNAQPGQRDALLGILLDGLDGMPGCLSYVVAIDPDDADALWITEVWDSRDSHQASLQLPSVRDAIARARPLIAGFSNHVETQPVGGIGLRSNGGTGSNGERGSEPAGA